MGNECEGGSCQSGQQEGCSSGGGCCSSSQGCGCSSSGCGEDKIAMMFHVAKKAKMELIKEKVKKKLEAVEGKKLDKVADLLVEAMLGKYRMKQEAEKKMQEMYEKFEAIFSEN